VSLFCFLLKAFKGREGESLRSEDIDVVKLTGIEKEQKQSLRIQKGGRNSRESLLDEPLKMPELG
jgi:hypothetical protein